MKKLIFIYFLTLGLIRFSYGQDQNNITGNFYVTNIDIPLVQFDLIENKVIILRKAIAKANTKFTAYKIFGDSLVVKFWNFGSLSEPKSQSQPIVNSEVPTYISMETNGQYFLMDLDDFNKMTTPYFGSKHSVVWGFSTIPIKLRFANEKSEFDFETAFTLGVNAGYEYSFRGRKEQAIAGLVGFGISTVDVYNVGEEPSSSAAFTPSLGILYSYDMFQIGLFTGVDIIGGTEGASWNYNNKPWLGIGMGFTIFQKNKPNNDIEQSQN
jgi:hypothetical protein